MPRLFQKKCWPRDLPAIQSGPVETSGYLSYVDIAFASTRNRNSFLLFVQIYLFKERNGQICFEGPFRLAAFIYFPGSRKKRPDHPSQAVQEIINFRNGDFLFRHNTNTEHKMSIRFWKSEGFLFCLPIANDQAVRTRGRFREDGAN